MTIEFGALSLADRQRSIDTDAIASAADRIDDIVGYGTLADRVGLDVFALGEHHMLDFAVSSPAVLLAAIAARTQRIRLTSAVTVLSVLDPVRVYQDFAQLDLIGHGRAELIVGRSAFVEPFAIFGGNPAEYDPLFAEKLDLLLRLTRSARATWAGHFRPPLNDAPVAPRAYQHVLPVWVGVGGTPASADRAGRLGLPMVRGYIGGPLARARQAVDAYRRVGERAGHPEKLRVGISTHFNAGENADAARDVFPYYHEYLRSKTVGGRGFLVDRMGFEAGTAQGQALMIGSSEELIAKIGDAHRVLGRLDRFFGRVDWGGLPRPLVEESIARLATEIAPAVRSALAS